MDKTRNTRTEIITSMFKQVLNNLDIRILDRTEEENIDYAIYLKDQYNIKYTDEQLGEFIADYALSKIDDKDKWIYMIAVHDMGGREEPPSSDFIESKELYDTFDDALSALILTIIDSEIRDIFEYHYMREIED